MSDTFEEAGVTLKFGTVSAVDADTCRVRVRLPDYDNLRTGWLQVRQNKTRRDKHYYLPDIGEHVAVLLDRQGVEGFVLGAVYGGNDQVPVTSGDKHHVRFADGSWIEFDRSTGKFAMDLKGDAVVKAPKVTLDTPEADTTGNFTVKGKLTYQGGLSGSGGTAEIEGDVKVRGGDLDVQGKKFLPHSHRDAHGGDTGPVN